MRLMKFVSEETAHTFLEAQGIIKAHRNCGYFIQDIYSELHDGIKTIHMEFYKMKMI